MRCHQTRRARRIVARDGPLYAKDEGKAASCNRDSPTGGGVNTAILYVERAKVGVHDAEKDTDISSAQRLSPLAC